MNSKQTKILLIVGFTGSLVGLAIYLNNKAKDIARFNSRSHLRNHHEKVKELSKSYIQEDDSGFLTRAAMLKFFNLWAQECFQDFHELLQKHRRERRVLLSQIDKYIKSCEEYTVALNKIVKSHFEELLKDSNLPIEKWKKSFGQHFGKGTHKAEIELEMVQTYLKDKLPVKHHLALTDAQRIMREQLKKIDVLDIAKIINDCQRNYFTLQNLTFVLESWIFDRVYDNTGYEEEETFLSIKTAAKDDEASYLICKDYLELLTKIH